jgi:HAD superfamily hydrolase (TIGR01509 family)
VHHAVLFDMDGVLVDTDRPVAEFWRKLARSDGACLTEQDLRSHVYGRSARHTLRELFPRIPPERYGEILDRMRENDQHQRYTAITGVLDLVRELLACGVPLALVTGAEDWKVAEVLSQLGLSGAFRTEVRAGDVPNGKPDPECYRLAAERLDVDIHRCLVFEDAVSGVAAAVTAGATCVALVSERHRTQMLDLGAAVTVPDFSSVHYSPAEQLIHLRPDVAFSLARSGTAAA